jgi:hypothetical protein
MVRDQLHSFYVQAYHLKDALKNYFSSIGRNPHDIEAVVNKSPRLALLADLANLDKHGRFTKPPRSGHTPKIKRVSGIDEPGSRGWRLSMIIEHDGRELDGLEVARWAIDTWEAELRAFGLLP